MFLWLGFACRVQFLKSPFPTKTNKPVAVHHKHFKRYKIITFEKRACSVSLSRFVSLQSNNRLAVEQGRRSKSQESRIRNRKSSTEKSPNPTVNSPPKVSTVRARLHQASTPTQSQRCDDACNIPLIEINGVTTKWVTTPFCSDSICFHWFQRELCCKHHRTVDSALTLTLGVNEPLCICIYSEELVNTERQSQR